MIDIITEGFIRSLNNNSYFLVLPSVCLIYNYYYLDLFVFALNNKLHILYVFIVFLLDF